MTWTVEQEAVRRATEDVHNQRQRQVLGDDANALIGESETDRFARIVVATTRDDAEKKYNRKGAMSGRRQGFQRREHDERAEA